MKIQIELTTGNEAFENGESIEVGRILQGVADMVQDGPEEGEHRLHDYNGNTVGKVVFTDVPEYDDPHADDYDFDQEWDGQPDEAQEWHDFDPDC